MGNTAFLVFNLMYAEKSDKKVVNVIYFFKIYGIITFCERGVFYEWFTFNSNSSDLDASKRI